MSTHISGLVWTSDVGPVGKRMLLLALADNAKDSGLCWPGVEYLVGKTGLSRASVFRLFKELEAEGILERHGRRRANGSQRSSFYKIDPDALAKRRRSVPKEEREEEAEFDKIVKNSQVDDRVSSCDSADFGQAADESGGETGDVSSCDGEGLTVGPPGGLTMGPLEPQEEPLSEPSGETSRAREAAPPPCVDDPVEVDFSRNTEGNAGPDPLGRQIAQVERKRARAARTPAAMNETAHSPSSRGVVEAFLETFKVRPVTKVVAQWCASVSELQKADYSELLIKRAMVACRDGGYPPSALASFASGLAGQPDEPARKKSRGTAKMEAEMQDGIDRYGIDPQSAFKLMYPHAKFDAEQPPQTALGA